MLVGICKLDLLFSEVHSLKEKRRLLQAIKEKTSQKFKVPVSEVDHQDLWQRAEIGFSLVGSDGKKLESLMSEMVAFVEGLDLARVTERVLDVIEF